MSAEALAKLKLERVQRVFDALAHATRRQILMTIHFRGGAMSAGEIAARFGHTWATTTGHLNALVESGLLTRAHEGRKRIYRIDRRALAVATEWLAWFDGDASEQQRRALGKDAPVVRIARKAPG